VKRGYTVFGYGVSAPDPAITMVDSRKAGILQTELSVFEMLEDTAAVDEALQAVNGNPLHRKITFVIFSTLLTWGGRTFPKEEEEAAEPNAEEGGPEEEEEDPEPAAPITGEEFLSRVPLDAVRAQYARSAGRCS